MAEDWTEEDLILQDHLENLIGTGKIKDGLSPKTEKEAEIITTSLEDLMDLTTKIEIGQEITKADDNNSISRNNRKRISHKLLSRRKGVP